MHAEMIQQIDYFHYLAQGLPGRQDLYRQYGQDQITHRLKLVKF